MAKTRKPLAAETGMPTGELSPLERHALKIAGKTADPLRDRLLVGNGQAVDVTVRITGAIDVGADSSPPKSGTPKTETLVAMMLDNLSKPVRSKLLAALAPASTAYREDATEAAISDEAQRLAEDLIAAFTFADTGHKRGSVTGSLSVTRVDTLAKVA